MAKKITLKTATLDCETDPFLRGRLPEPFIWGFYDGDTYRHFPTIGELLAWLETADDDYCIYAHNGGKFDYHFMLEHLEPFSDVLLINGRLAKFCIGRHEFRDSYCILPIALREYRKDDIDYRKLERKVRDQHMPEIRAYLKTDCVALYEIISEFKRVYGDGLTLATSALSYWSEMTTLAPPVTGPAFYSSMKKYYYGGRVQCFHRGPVDVPCRMLDINSAYPFAMLLDHPFSTKPRIHVPEKDAPVIPQSFYTIEGVSAGAFPWRETEKSALAFPEDRTPRTYHVTGWELQAALDTQTFQYDTLVQRVDFGVDVDFCDYINHFYTMKKESKKGTPEYIFAKLFMNSLYGKFGANPEKYLSYGIVPAGYEEPAAEMRKLKLGKNFGPWSASGNLGPWSLMVGKDPETGEHNPTRSKYYNVATAASITGCVRAYLWRQIHAARENGDAVLYCDTDSIVTTGDGSAFKIGKELGEWGIDGIFDRGGIAGKKMYAFHNAEYKKGDDKATEWKCASKGVRLEAEAILAVANGAEVSFLNPVASYSMLAKNGPKFIDRTIRRTG